MIPFALLSMKLSIKKQNRGLEGKLIDQLAQSLEVRVLDLAPDGFTFRLAHSYDELIEGQLLDIRLSFLHYDQNSYGQVVLADVRPVLDEKTEYYTVWRVETEDEVFAAEARRLMRDYMEYIDLKMTGDAETAKAKAGYPSEKDQIFAEDFDAQKQQWFSDICPDQIYGRVLSEKPQAIVLENSLQYAQFLKLPVDEYVKWYFESAYLEKFVPYVHPDRIYIGSQFCSFLFPEEDVLRNLLGKAEREKLKVSICLAPVSEDRVHVMEGIISFLNDWCKEELEIAIDDQCREGLKLVVNDWMVPAYIRHQGYTCFDLTLGTLLNKRRKDPRMAYKNGAGSDGLDGGENALTADFYADHLKRLGITGEITESCGALMGKNSFSRAVIMPWYQTNTAGHCTLYAAVKNGARGCQQQVRACEEYCLRNVFLYPDHLMMTGKYNSLFALDKKVLTDADYMHKITEDADRIVWHLL